ncbi:hypothetical protein C1M51_02885 [Methylibium sp. Pch-M]|uniref:helix-turn-helix domain-containing protein n=1 Tax=Methylibium sp. Pch-M TaxID=2082386 RepID=UPI0010100ACE|nr:helix-turn-helix transcriptional regulator [Methylibium sp. Pch-M]QAZ38450.1 hypothetical protein C1M51_02885 [Methylibium sp. Pch-M]
MLSEYNSCGLQANTCGLPCTTRVVKLARMALGARIKEVREGLGWGQTDLCDRVPGLTQQSLSNLENRDSKTSEFGIRIADALGVSVRWLLDGQGDRADRDWPFAKVERHRWDDCSQNDKGYVESAMNIALKECEALRGKPNGTDG